MVFTLNGKDRMFAFTEITFGQIIEYLYGRDKNLDDYEIFYFPQEQSNVNCEFCHNWYFLEPENAVSVELKPNDVLKLNMHLQITCYSKEEARILKEIFKEREENESN